MGTGAEMLGGGSPEWRAPADQAPVSAGYPDGTQKVANVAMKAGEVIPVGPNVIRDEVGSEEIFEDHRPKLSVSRAVRMRSKGVRPFSARNGLIES